MQILRSTTDLALQKSHIKQIFLCQARYLQAQTHHEEQTDERISQTIFGIQSNQWKLNFFSGFSVRYIGCFEAPAEEENCFDGKAEPSLQATCLPLGGSERAARSPRQGRQNRRSPSETTSPAKFSSFHDFSTMRFLRPATDQ